MSPVLPRKVCQKKAFCHGKYWNSFPKLSGILSTAQGALDTKKETDKEKDGLTELKGPIKRMIQQSKRQHI